MKKEVLIYKQATDIKTDGMGSRKRTLYASSNNNNQFGVMNIRINEFANIHYKLFNASLTID